MDALFVDSHCHIPMLSQAGSPAGVQYIINTAQDHGVSHFLCVAIDLGSLRGVLTLAERYDNVFASVGVHPNSRCEPEPTAEMLLPFVTHPKIIAIGETGLDYYRSQGELEWQRQRFREHIRCARCCGMPLIVHMRDASPDTLAILEQEKAYEVGGVIHCYTGTYETAARAIGMNFLISFSGIVTFRNAVALQQVARAIPLDKMLVETDCPYLAPVPHRGHENQPAYVRYVGEFIAKLKGLAVEEVARQTTTNFFRLFPHARSAA
ncbi:MAG: TatD family hydrolase [Chromatiales bacterium]